MALLTNIHEYSFHGFKVGRPSNGDPVSGSEGQSGQPQGVAPTNGKKLSLPDIVYRFMWSGIVIK